MLSPSLSTQPPKLYKARELSSMRRSRTFFIIWKSKFINFSLNSKGFIEMHHQSQVLYREPKSTSNLGQKVLILDLNQNSCDNHVPHWWVECDDVVNNQLKSSLRLMIVTSGFSCTWLQETGYFHCKMSLFWNNHYKPILHDGNTIF